MNNYTKLFNRPAIVSNAEKLPFKDNSVDCIFTHAFLEHPIHPENVISEIARVIKPGGIVIHCDAWHCRWWQRFGIVGIKNISEMSFREKSIYVLAKLTSIKLIRFSNIVSKRFFTELFMPIKSGKQFDFKYKKLKPNYDLHLYCDEDAASSLDPLNVIRFYESRGFELVVKKSFFQRIFYRVMDIRLIKKQSNFKMSCLSSLPLLLLQGFQ